MSKRVTPGTLSTPTSISRGRAMSSSSRGRCRRRSWAAAMWGASSTGCGALVALITTSAASSAPSSSVQASALPPTRSAMRRARSSVRLMHVMALTPCRCRAMAAVSAISPAPMTRAWRWGRLPSVCSASRAAAWLIEMVWLPMAVSARARLPQCSAWPNRCESSGPWLPAACAACAASATWPRICGSPRIIESSPQVTRNRWRTASASCA